MFRFDLIRQARYSNMVPIPTRREHEGSLSVLAARAQHDEQLSQECSGEVLQAYIDDHTLCVTPKTAEEAFAKGRVSICDGARQRGDGELLFAAEDRMHRAQDLSTMNEAEQTRLYRAVLQCDPPSFDDRTSALLGSTQGGTNLTMRPSNRQQRRPLFCVLPLIQREDA